MFAKTLKTCLERSNREFAKRLISKTSSAPNSDAITAGRAAAELKKAPNKWARLNKNSNNRYVLRLVLHYFCAMFRLEFVAVTFRNKNINNHQLQP